MYSKQATFFPLVKQTKQMPKYYHLANSYDVKLLLGANTILTKYH